MAKGKKTGGRNFQKGQVSNPRGGGALTPQTRALRKITIEHLEEIADLILQGNIEELKRLATDPSTSVMKVWIAKAAVAGMTSGNLHSLEIILNRVMGRPRETVQISGLEGGPIKTENVFETAWRDGTDTDKEPS
jgi:hypothetical protein